MGDGVGTKTDGSVSRDDTRARQDAALGQEAQAEQEAPPAKTRSAGGVASASEASDATLTATPASPLFLIHESKVSTNPPPGGVGHEAEPSPADVWETSRESVFKRLGRYGKGKDRGRQMAAWIKKHHGKDEWESAVRWANDLAGDLRRCASLLEFRRVLTGGRAGETILAGGKFCQKAYLCQVCAIRRGAKYLQAYGAKLRQVLSDHPHLQPLFVTLTVRDGDDLKSTFLKLHNSVQGWLSRGRKARGGGRHVTELRNLAGGVRSYEITIGKNSGQWHPHCHAIWLVDGSLDWGACQREWSKQVGYSAQANFKKLKSTLALENGSLEPADYGEALTGDLMEIFKYAVKFSSLPLSDNWHVYKTLKGRQLIKPFGLLWGLKIDPSNLDEPLDWEQVTYARWLYAWNRRFGKYYLKTEQSDAVD